MGGGSGVDELAKYNNGVVRQFSVRHTCLSSWGDICYEVTRVYSIQVTGLHNWGNPALSLTGSDANVFPLSALRI